MSQLSLREDAERSPALERDHLWRWVANCVNQVAGIPVDLITEEVTIDRELELSSIALLELQVAIEEKYDIEIDPVHVVRLNRFGAIVDYVHRIAVAHSR